MQGRAAIARRAALLAGALLATALPAAAEAAGRPSLPALERQLMCVTCKIPLQEARSPQAESERNLIRQLIAEGKSEAQIKRALVAEYGQAVLSLPAASGFNLLVYLVPGLVVAAAALLLFAAARRWRRRVLAEPALDHALPRLRPDEERQLREALERLRD